MFFDIGIDYGKTGYTIWRHRELDDFLLFKFFNDIVNIFIEFQLVANNFVDGNADIH